MTDLTDRETRLEAVMESYLRSLEEEHPSDRKSLLSAHSDLAPELEEFIEGAPMHTDDNSLLEFGAPEYIYKDERHIIVRQLTPFFTASRRALLRNLWW